MFAFCYKMTYDTGFAPNTQDDILTLATCKPKIRRKAEIGDWLFGFGSKTLGKSTFEKLIYVAKITEVLTIEDYGNNPRFKNKIPSKQNPIGDNIYYCDAKGIWQQRPYSPHTQNDMKHDLGGRNVLVSTKFLYFGCQPVECPSFITAFPERGHRRINCAPVQSDLEKWFSSFKQTNNFPCQKLSFCNCFCGS